MKLKRLIIQGFKSFKDRTTIEFDHGITGIVGPNGCGKSNIVDALFWVMGEQSAKHLRGSTMKDVIFSGSSKFSPGSFASATLVLENNKGKHIHIGHKVTGPSEIQLTRKLYRNGETEYRINGEPARLRDIQEVFMDTGAGAKSYSIIAQGEINRLVQARPEERRVMIEEVAGITKFKMRKRESLRKIEQTQLNLGRLQDLKQEIEKNLQSLQKQAEKAERARSLKEKIRKNELIVDSHKVFDILKGFREGKNIVNENDINIEAWKIKKSSLEVSLEDERLQKDEKIAEVEELQQAYNEISKGLAASEERLNSLGKSITQKEELIAEREKEAENIREEILDRTTRLEKLCDDREKLEHEGLEENNFTELEERIEDLKEQIELKRMGIADEEQNLSSMKDELSETQEVIYRNTNRIEELSAQLQDIANEVEVLEKEYSGVSTEISKERDACNEAMKLEEDLIIQEANLKRSVEDLTSELQKKDTLLREEGKKLVQSESKLESLREINRSLEGAKEGASAFLQTIEDGSYRLLGSLIQCDEKYSGGVQALLAEFVDTLVTSDENIDRLKSWKEQSDEELALDMLIPHSQSFLSDETIERLKIHGMEDIIALEDIVELPEDYSSRLRPMLKGYFLIPEMSVEKFEKISGDINFKGISSFLGDKMIHNIGGGKVLTITGSNDISQGVIDRNNKIVELDELVETLKDKIIVLEEEARTSRECLENAQKEHDCLRNEMIEARADFAAKKSALNSKLGSFETGNKRLEILKNRKSDISKRRLELLECEDELSKKEEDLRGNVDEASSELEEKTESFNFELDSYNQEREVFIQKQVEAKSFDERQKGLLSQIEDVEKQIEKQKGRQESNGELVEKYKIEISNMEEELEALEASNHETAGELQDREDVLNLMKDTLGELLAAMQEREEEVKKISTSISKAEKETALLEGKLGQYLVEEEQIVRNIFEKYQIDLRKTIGRFLEYSEVNYLDLSDLTSMYWIEGEAGPVEVLCESYEFHRRYGQDLKDCGFKLKNFKSEFNRLGEVNWQAIEDYERQKLRFNFLRKQEEELKISLLDLENAINHIDEKSRNRFKIAFEEVNMRFEKVFPIIFGGGSAKLQVNGNINDIDCGIEIIASPPGKKMQNINLMSGGEKALTAVALIFSIFLVKPSPFCLLDEVDAPLDDANVGRFNELLREMSEESQFILITHNKKTMELNDTLYGVTMQEPGVSKAVSVQLH